MNWFRRKGPDDLLFRSRRGSILGHNYIDGFSRRIISGGCSLSVAKFSMHDLRVSACNFWIKKGMTLESASDRMGHSNVGITLGYLRMYERGHYSVLSFSASFWIYFYKLVIGVRCYYKIG